MADNPQQVKVGRPHSYTIKYSKKEWKDADLPSDIVGLCRIAETTIFISEWELSPSQVRDTVLHEICHAVLGLVGLDNQPFDIPTEMHDVEEMFVLFLTPGLLQVMQDNPDLVKWLQGETN